MKIVLFMINKSVEPEKFNPWNYKPWWCQPWSILLMGITIISISWFIFRTVGLTVILSIPILTWMGFFLIIWPKLMAKLKM
jgi:hypothetical protein